MAVISTKDYQNKKDFAAALENAAAFDRFVVDDLQGTERDGEGTWSTDRMARGENTTLAMYSAIAARMAETDFQKFVKLSGRFVAKAKKKAKSDAWRDGKASYYAEWQTRDGETYYIFCALDNAAKYEQLWDWANGMGLELRLNSLTSDEAAVPKEQEEPLNCTFAQKGGETGWALYDNDAEKFTRIPLADQPGEFLERVLTYQAVGGIGWVFRQEENGRWGFISSDFRQAVSPRFERFIGWSPDSEGEAESFAAFGYVYDVPGARKAKEEDEFAHMFDRKALDLWFYDGSRAPHLLRLLDEVRASAARVAAELKRTTGESWEENELLDWDNWPYPSMDSEEPSTASFEYDFDWVCRDGADSESFRFLFHDNSDDDDSLPNRRWVFFFCEDADQLAFRTILWDDGILRLDGAEMPCERLDLAACCAARESKVSYGKLRSLGDGVFAERRDGYWGLFHIEDYESPDCEHPEILLPYAFSGIRLLHWNCFLVERFGSKGVVWGYDAPQFIIPTQYESVEWIDDDEACFRVRRMGFVGTLNYKGEWVEQLHREKEESFDFDPDGGQ